MPVQDFLITFRADTTGALTAINALAARVKQVDASLNAAMGGLNKTAGSIGGASSGLNRAFDLQQQLKKGRFANVQEELRTARQLETALFRLERRGEPVAAALAQARREVDRLAAAAQRAKSVDRLLTTRGRLDSRLENTRLQGGDDRSTLRAAMRNEEALSKLGDTRAPGRLQDFQRQFAALPPAIDRSTASMLAFNRALQQRVTMGERLNLPNQSAGALTKGLDNGIELMKRGMGEGADAVEFFSQRVAGLPATLDRAAQGMLNHGRRVAEGLVIYELLGRAMQAVGDQITLVNNLAREQIRFSAVSGGLGAGGSSQFLLGLQDIAVRTNTPMDELAAQIDTVGVAMLNNGDAAQRMADSQQFLNDVGQFTNITQRDLATETENLLGIMSMSTDGVDEFSDRLGRIVTAGNNSSRLISEITDVLSEAGRSARATGFDFDFLASIGGQLSQELLGTMSGSEIGGMLNTIIGRLTDPEVINKVKELSNGIISFSNADGSLRSTSDILIDIFQAIEDGTISAQAAPRILDQIVPPLNPAARAFVTALQRNIPDALRDMDRIMGGSAENAEALSDALVSGPGERFAASMKDIQGALTGIFTEEIINAGNTFADMLKGLASLLGSGEAGGGIGGTIASVAIKIAIFGAALATVSFAWRNISAMLFAGSRRMDAIKVAIAGMTTAATTNTVATSGMAVSAARAGTAVAGFGTAARVTTGGLLTMAGATAGLKGAMAGLLGVAKGLLPILLTMAAIELPGQIDASGAAQRVIDSDEAVGRSRLKPEDLRAALVNVNSGPVSGILEEIAKSLPSDLSRNQRTNILEVAKALTILEQQGKLTAASQKAIEEQVLGANGVIKEQTFTAHELIGSMDVLIDSTAEGSGSWNGYSAAVGGTTEELNALTSAEQRAAAAMELNAGLTTLRAAEITRLNDQLRNGVINLDEFNDAQSNLGSVTETASAFVAAFGDQLEIIPGLQERISQTGESAAEALSGILLANPETVDEQIDIINRMIEILEITEEAATEVEENPITPRFDTKPLADGTIRILETFGLLDEARVAFERAKITPQVDLMPLSRGMQNALRMFGILGQAQSLVFSKMGASKTLGSLPKGGDSGASTSGVLSGLMAELEALGNSVGVVNGILKDDPRLSSGSSSGPSQTGIVDIGDLPASTIQQIIALASAAQAQVVAAGGVVDTDETAAIFKDAAFQTLIRGVDQRFLQQAIEELTEVEKRRLELEQMRLQDVTRSTVVQTGPIQSIVSAPVLSAGGGVLTGQGFNADPRLGNFTINVPINWSGMNLEQLQAFIYSSISQAWVDAGRGA